MMYSRAVASMMLFILVFAKDYKYYNLSHGPMKHETGRYIYQPQFGDPKYCRYCPLEALLNSEYHDARQYKCGEKYHGKNIAEVILPQENASSKYPLCDKGEVPGCGPPPEINKTKNHEWVCDPGYSFVNYSVYFKCALVCNITERLDWQYYCNESLQWEVQPASTWQKCEAPVIEPKIIEPESIVKLVIMVAVIVGSVVIAILAYFSCLCYKKIKRARSREDMAVAEMEEMNAERVGLNDVRLDINEGNEETADPFTPESDLEGGSQSGNRSPSRAESLSGSTRSSDTEDDEGSTDDENTKLIMPHPSVKPTVSIIQFEGGERKKSIPWQGDIYSIERGSDFQIIPNSTGGYEVTKFRIERKGNSAIGWEEYIHMYNVKDASDVDAGLYMWYITLTNKIEYCGSFEISIALPAIRPNTIGKEASNKDTSSLKTVNPVYNQPQQPSSTSHLKFDSILNNQNDQDVIEDNELLPQGNLVRGEVVKETRGDADPFRHAADLSSEMFRDQLQRNTIDSGVQSSNGHRISSSSNIASDRVVSQRNNSNDNTRDGDLRYSTSGYQTQTSASLAREQFRAIFDDAPQLSIGSLNKKSRELSMGLDIQALQKRGYLNPSEDRNEDTGARGGEYTGTRAGEYTGTRAGEYSCARVDEDIGARAGEYTHAGADQDAGARAGEYTGARADQDNGARIRPDPAGSVSPMNHSEGSGSIQETFRKQLYVPDITQQEAIVDHHHDTADDDDIGDDIAHDNGDDDVDSISERLNSVALQNDILGDGHVYGVEGDLEHAYPEGEIQHLPYRHDSVLENDLEHHIDDHSDS
ncbi:uncharacterized protein LOC132719592 isoform X2 [Ruditapes philippinarum]|uniref:uncharacterized protein LOC132719592 isoform X2 n=1 Tax=Ruditapes philippinarum TaxID=129788 RepID=UPI00295AB291|nr:uncharacterized protein LOC132719592 isoform X2 [Ruditapes philippinarum]